MLSKNDHNRAGGHLSPQAIASTGKTNRVPAQSNTMLTEEVAIHETYEQYQRSQISLDPSSISGEGSLYVKSDSLRLDYDVEKNAESGI
jgi:hypothetical protein